ncbi:hypothetical protein HPP92_002746 [Vanilla planifolia]|uniref:Uncharacterized protein n=1 Tax=Vanilla planifolia TaxID=51239 RepID=A0A835VIA7_VANPL|nr:hypothetical protein HPP92_002746 [Vanilla planifolia]
MSFGGKGEASISGWIKSRIIAFKFFCSPRASSGGRKRRWCCIFPDDCQIDAIQTVGFIEKGNRNFAAKGRYVEFYNNPAICILSSERGAPVIQTPRNVLHFKKALVIAAGPPYCFGEH